MDVSSLIHSMVGKAFGQMFPARPEAVTGETLLEVKDLSLPGRFQDVSFDLRAGEIFGIAGFVGSGRSELARAIFGREPAASGEIRLRGNKVIINSPRTAMDSKIGMIPEDRKMQALHLEAPMFENLTFNSLTSLNLWGWVCKRKRLTKALDRITSFNIQPAQPLKIVQELSGGTQQKVVLGNWMFEGFEILIMDEPTRGIDVGTKAEIFRIIRTWADQGVGIILISSEFSELTGMCDRILVIREGKQVDILNGRTSTEEMVLQSIFKFESGRNDVAMV
jgi:ABC-type sugar transport system ATPase subunit